MFVCTPSNPTFTSVLGVEMKVHQIKDEIGQAQHSLTVEIL